AEPCRDERVLAGGGAALRGKCLGGGGGRDDGAPLGRKAQERRLPGRVVTRRDEAVDGPDGGRLVPSEGRRIHRRFRERAAAVQKETRERVAVVAAEAGGAVARRDPDRAEEPQVVEVHDDGGAGAAGGLQGARPEQGQRVVGMHHVGVQVLHGGPDVVLVAAAPQQRPRGGRARYLGRRALEQRVLNTGPAERLELQLDRALLASLQAVAVVDDEDAHA